MRATLFFIVALLVSHHAFSQVEESRNYGTITATCADGYNIKLYDFTVTVKLKGYAPSAGNVFKQDFWCSFDFKFTPDSYVYDRNGKKALLSEIPDVQNVMIHIDYFPIEINLWNYNTNSSLNRYIGLIKSSGTIRSNIFKGSAYESNVKDWKEVAGENWKENIKNASFGIRFPQTVVYPKLEAYHTSIKQHFKSLEIKELKIKKLEK